MVATMSFPCHGCYKQLPMGWHHGHVLIMGTMGMSLIVVTSPRWAP